MVRLVTGHWTTQALFVAAKLGIADLVAEGPRTPEDLAQACRWLSSPLSSYISGSAVWLHGGGERPAFLGAVDS